MVLGRLTGGPAGDPQNPFSQQYGPIQAPAGPPPLGSGGGGAFPMLPKFGGMGGLAGLTDLSRLKRGR